MSHIDRKLNAVKATFGETTVAVDLRRLADRPVLPPLAPTRPWDISFVTTVKTASPESLLAPHAVVSVPGAAAVKSGLLLWADALDASHTVAQDHEDHTTCSYWHAIMHRREPDFGNCKYWCRRVGAHPIHAELRNGALQILRGSARGDVVDYMTDVEVEEDWQPERLVDACELACQPGADAEFVRCLEQIQVLEFALLLDYSHREAIGTLV